MARLLSARRVWLAVPLLFLVPTAAGLLIYVSHLVSTPWPALGWATAISTDAASFSAPGAPYGDPATSYTGQLYTPFFPYLIHLLDSAGYWHGWPLLLAVGGGLANAALVAYAARPRLPWLAAAGLGALGWSFVFTLSNNGLDQGRSDQVAWAMALWGLVLWSRGARGSGRALGAAILLMSAAFWTKQTTAVAPVAAVIWSAWEVRRGTVGRRRAWLGMAAMAVLNLAVLAALNVRSDGWEWFLHFELAQSYATPNSTGFAVGDLAKSLGLEAVAALLVGAVLLRAARRLEGTSAVDTSVLFFFLPVATIIAVYSRRFVGTEDNHYIGLAWSLAALLAAAYANCSGTPRLQMTAAAVLLTIALTTIVVPDASRLSLRQGSVIPVPDVQSIPLELREFAHRHDVYNGIYTDLAADKRRPVRQHFQAVQNLLWGGRAPGALVQDLLRRRIEVAYLFPEGLDSAGAGKWEEGWFWKINEVIRAKYRLAPDTPLMTSLDLKPGHGWRRTSGPDPAPWIDSCFTPIRTRHATFRVHAGGGLWCTDPRVPGRVSLHSSPASTSQLVTTDPVRSVAGQLVVRLPQRRGAWRIVLGDWDVTATVGARPSGIRLTAGAHKVFVPASTLHRTRGRVTLVLGGEGRADLTRGEVRVPVPRPSSPHVFEIWATADSGARFDLSRLVFT